MSGESSDRRFLFCGKRNNGSFRRRKIGKGLIELRAGISEIRAHGFGGSLNLRDVLSERSIVGGELSNAGFKGQDLLVRFSDVEKFESSHSTLRGEST